MGRRSVGWNVSSWWVGKRRGRRGGNRKWKSLGRTTNQVGVVGDKLFMEKVIPVMIFLIKIIFRSIIATVLCKFEKVMHKLFCISNNCSCLSMKLRTFFEKMKEKYFQPISKQSLFCCHFCSELFHGNALKYLRCRFFASWLWIETFSFFSSVSCFSISRRLTPLAIALLCSEPSSPLHDGGITRS